MNILIHVILTVAILMAFLPFLKSNDDGYQGATVVVPKAEPEKVVEAVVEEVPAEVPAEVLPEVVSEAVTESPVKEVIEEVVDAAATTSEAGLEDDDKSALYSVVDGNKLDKDSYAGFKLYRNWCARCHGTYGQGMVGPNLADSLKVISEKEFFDTVANGKSGTIGSMPAWKANVKVMEGRDQLYAYLMARSDGAIGVVKPKKQ